MKTVIFARVSTNIHKEKDNYRTFDGNEALSIIARLSVNYKNNLLLTNINTNDFVEIECESLYDYIIFEDKDNYRPKFIEARYDFFSKPACQLVVEE